MWWFGDFLFDFLTIWVIIDPITVLPIFIAVTADCDRATRRRIAGFTALIALAVLIFFIAAGQIIIIAMGISLHAFEIAGGLILLLFAIDLVIGAGKPVATDGAGNASALQRAIYPLAIPSLAGPGAMRPSSCARTTRASAFSSKYTPRSPWPSFSESPTCCCCRRGL